VIRAFKLSDFDYFVEFFSDAEASRHVGGPSGVEDIWRRLLAGVGMWPLTGLGMWAVERREDGKTIGHIGLFDFLRTSEPSISGQVEMGWILAPSAHGKGFANEACNAILGWFEQNFGKHPIWALISLENERSMKLAERLGFVRQPDGLYRDKPEGFWLRPA
jgi:RimJ/RimL family protein N-acetyltransferase